MVNLIQYTTAVVKSVMGVRTTSLVVRAAPLAVELYENDKLSCFIPFYRGPSLQREATDRKEALWIEEDRILIKDDEKSKLKLRKLTLS